MYITSVTPHLRGEALIGTGLATHKTAFKNVMFHFGVTPTRLIFVTVDRRQQPSGDVIELTESDVVRSSVNGSGAGLRHALGDNAGEVWIDTRANGKLKLSMLGDGILDRKLGGEAQAGGAVALCEFLERCRVN